MGQAMLSGSQILGSVYIALEIFLHESSRGAFFSGVDHLHISIAQS